MSRPFTVDKQALGRMIKDQHRPYRTVINVSTGKKTKAREGYAKQLQKAGTHKIIG